MPRKPRGWCKYLESRHRSANSTGGSRSASQRANLTCKRLGLPSTCGRPQWRSSRSISPIMLRIKGNWGREAANFGSKLSARPFRGPLLGKRLRSLDVVLRRRHGFHRGILALLGHRLLQRDAEALLDGLLGGTDRHRTVLAYRLRSALGPSQGFALRHHFIDKTKFVPLARTDMTGGQDHAHRALQPDLPRQAVQPSRQRGQPDAWFGQRECRIFRGDDEVAGERNLETAAHGDAVDRRDNRFVAIEARRQAGKTALVPA